MKVTGSDFDGTITTNNVIVIKPHHLLDIFKLYGKGIENFIPDKNYNHNFYLIGNAVIRNEVNKIRFTYSYDDICKPCYYLKNSVCSDYFSANEVDINKNKFNEKLDIRLMKLLNLKFDETYEFKNIGYISKMVNSRNRINEKIIFLHVSNTEEICDLMHSFLD